MFILAGDFLLFGCAGAGFADRGSETAKRLEGFASVRSTLAGLAETGLNVPPLCKGRGTTKWWKGCKKQSLTACGGAPFTQGSRNYPR